MATLEIKRPPHNFFDNFLLECIADAYQALAEETDCRAIVVCSEGKNFSAGGNYDPLEKNGEAKLPALDLDAFFKQVVRIFRNELPVIAAIQGAAVGGGAGNVVVVVGAGNVEDVAGRTGGAETTKSSPS